MPRALIALRVNEQALASIDALAEQTGSNRSNVIRVLLGEAMKNPTTRKAATMRLSAEEMA